MFKFTIHYVLVIIKTLLYYAYEIFPVSFFLFFIGGVCCSIEITLKIYTINMKKHRKYYNNGFFNTNEFSVLNMTLLVYSKKALEKQIIATC